MPEVLTPTRTPTRTPTPAEEPERRMNPDILCPAQKDRLVRRIEREL